jgi:hypothetical protein
MDVTSSGHLKGLTSRYSHESVRMSSSASSDNRNSRGPVGGMKKLVSLVDRGAFDNIVYPQSERTTLFQPDFQPYHNFVNEVITWPFAGVAEWGKRITFTVPQPWETDMLSWIALRLKPLHWLPADVANRMNKTKEWEPTEPDREWVWTDSLGSSAIALAEMEVDGIIIESWTGDWIHAWSLMTAESGAAAARDSILGRLGGTEDGYVYCFLPFWFSRWHNSAFPLLSTTKPVRFHITLRPFNQLVRRRSVNKTSCNETPLGDKFVVRDRRLPFIRYRDVHIGSAVPVMEQAELICGTAHIDGELRKAYRDLPHEMLMHPVTQINFAEPLKYVVGVPSGNVIHINLPLTEVNGPVRQLAWFLRRKAAIDLRADWTNFSATLEGEVDPVWNPRGPLLRRAQLLIGTAVWVDQDEKWWRSTGALPLSGGIRAYGNYLYVHNFATDPSEFGPTGSVNTSRVDTRLLLEIEQPDSPHNNEWEVVVFATNTNWMRFENGIANRLFID